MSLCLCLSLSLYACVCVAAVCVSLQEVWQLLQEFQALISSYIMKYQPPDTAEWRSVIQEVCEAPTSQPARQGGQHTATGPGLGQQRPHGAACSTRTPTAAAGSHAYLNSTALPQQAPHRCPFLSSCFPRRHFSGAWRRHHDCQHVSCLHVLPVLVPCMLSPHMQVTNFLHADVAMPVPRSPGQNVPFRLSLRCAPNQAEVKAAPHKMLLHDAVLVSYYPRQVKIAELPLDSFRMLQVGVLLHGLTDSLSWGVAVAVVVVSVVVGVSRVCWHEGSSSPRMHRQGGAQRACRQESAAGAVARRVPLLPCSVVCLQALEWEDQYSSATPPANEHPMPLPRSGSKGNLSEGMGGRRNSTGNLAENGVPEMGEWSSQHPASSACACMQAGQLRRSGSKAACPAQKPKPWILGPAAAAAGYQHNM